MMNLLEILINELISKRLKRRRDSCQASAKRKGQQRVNHTIKMVDFGIRTLKVFLVVGIVVQILYWCDITGITFTAVWGLSGLVEKVYKIWLGPKQEEKAVAFWDRAEEMVGLCAMVVWKWLKKCCYDPRQINEDYGELEPLLPVTIVRPNNGTD